MCSFTWAQPAEASAFALCQDMPSLQLVRGITKPPLCEALILTDYFFLRISADARVVLFYGLLRVQTRVNQGMS